jgi:2-iminobutanoate/2-iminopropanoate deaminase
MNTHRRSVNIENFSHAPQPIPAASRVGNIVATGGIYGLNRQTGKVPDDLTEQTRLMFENLIDVLAAAGAGLDQIVKMNFWVRNADARGAINPAWLKAFPDPQSRPARHTLQNDHMAGNLLIQCDALAVVD